MAGDEEQHAGRDQLVLAQLVARFLGGQELAQQIGARMAPTLGQQAAEVFAERMARGAAALDDLAVGVQAERIEAARDVGRPLAHRVGVLGGRAEQLADHRHRQRVGEVGDDVHRRAVLHQVEPSLDDRADARLQAVDDAAREGLADERAQARVGGRVAKDHRTRHALGIVAVDPGEGGAEPFAAEARVAHHRHHLVIARHDPVALGAAVDRVFGAQAAIERVGVGPELAARRVEHDLALQRRQRAFVAMPGDSGFGLGEPEAHVHRLEQRHRFPQVPDRRRALAGVLVHRAGGEMAACQERPHSHVGGERDRLAVAARRSVLAGGAAGRADVAEHAQRLGLGEALSVQAQKRQALLGRFERARRLAGGEPGFAQVGELEHLERHDAREARLQRLPLEQLEPFLDAPRPHVGQAEVGCAVLVERSEVGPLADLEGALEGGNREIELAAHLVALAEPQVGRGEAVGVARRLGDLDAECADLVGGFEIAQAGQAPCAPGSRRDRLQRRHAVAMRRRGSGAALQVAPEGVDRAAEVAQAHVRLALAMVDDRLERVVVKRDRDAARSLGVVERTVRVADAPAPRRHRRRDATLPARVVDAMRQLLGLAQDGDDARKVAERDQRAVQVEAQVDALGQRLARLGQVGQRVERLLDAAHRVLGGVARRRLQPRLVQVGDRLAPELAALRVVGEAVGLVGALRQVEALEHVDDPGIERAPRVEDERVVRHLLREGVLEGVLELREQAGLVEELGRLQAPEHAAQGRLLVLADRFEKRERHVACRSTAAVWSSHFSSADRRSIRAASTAWTVAGMCVRAARRFLTR